MQRFHLLRFVAALGCRNSALRRDECSDWRIIGRQGCIYATPDGFQLLFFARNGITEWDGEGPHMEDYIRAKRALIFCRLTQDGTGEGIFFLDRLPTSEEAETIRLILDILKKREMGEPSEAQLAQRAAFASVQRAKKHEQDVTSAAKSDAEEGMIPGDPEGDD